MSPNFHLVLHNIGAITSCVVSFILTGFMLFNNHKKTINISLAAANFFIGIFLVSHIIATNTTNTSLCQMSFVFNISIVFAVIATIQATFSILHKEKERKPVIIGLYTLGVLAVIFFSIFPDTFI